MHSTMHSMPVTVMFLALFGLARAQLMDGPGNGVAKSTYAASDPISGFEFMAKYLPVEEANDDCTGQVCTCDDDDETWYIQQGRAAL